MTNKINIEDKINTCLQTKQIAQLKTILEEINPVDLAAVFEKIENDINLINVFKLLNKERAAQTFSYCDSEIQQKIVEGVSSEEIQSLLSEMYLDDMTDFLDEMPANLVVRILKTTTPETRATINKLLSYDDDHTGSIMTTEFVTFKKDYTIKQALDHIRKVGSEVETINNCYIISDTHTLLGVISVKNLILANPKEKVNDIMIKNVIYGTTRQDKEETAKLLRKYGFLSLPIIDSEQKLVGIVTVDDAMEILKDEATEDFHKTVGMQPTEKPYLKTNVFEHSKSRLLWLIILTISAIFIGLIIESFEKAFLAMPVLVAFIPMIMGAGGNSGSQSSTIIIRGLALGEITLKNFFTVFVKEFLISLIVGFVLSMFVFARIMIQYKDALLGITVSLGLMCAVFMGKLLGVCLPMLAKKIKLDPALMSAPLITTLVDAGSLLAFFVFANTILPI